MMAILKFPVVAFAWVADRLRRVPGMGWVERHVPLVVATFVLLAVIALAAWAAQRSPQRLTLAGLSTGELANMQSWIIISGDLERDPLFPSQLRYILTDAGAPNAKLYVTSDVELALGRTTISGTVVGGRLGSPVGVRWVGQIVADAELAPEQDPPWLSIGFVAAGLLVGAASKSSYPVLFNERPKPVAPRPRRIEVGVLRGSRRQSAQRGTLVLTPGEPVEMRGTAQEPLALRLHSPHTSVDVGELRGLTRAAPALAVRLTTEELFLTFGSREERDAAHSALVTESARPQEG